MAVRRNSVAEQPDAAIPPLRFYGSSNTQYLAPDPKGAHAANLSQTGRPRSQSMDDLPDLVPLTDAPSMMGGTHPFIWTDHFTFPMPSEVPINGRDQVEECNWWDRNLQAALMRPGPGELPSILRDHILPSGTRLMTVRVDPSLIHEDPAPTTSVDSLGASTSSSSRSGDNPLPTSGEINEMLIHPDALYCPEENSWVLFHQAFNDLPSMDMSAIRSFPDPARRCLTTCCSGPMTNAPTNLSHHLHQYPEMTNDTTSTSHVSNVYMCCQCSFYCKVSKKIPGVLPVESLKEIVREKYTYPMSGIKGEQSAVDALQILLRVVERNAWKGEIRQLSTKGKTFQQLGWNQNVIKLLKKLGYSIADASDGNPIVRPPSLDTRQEDSRTNRIRMLKAWLEIHCFYVDFCTSQKPGSLKDDVLVRHQSVQLSDRSSIILDALGSREGPPYDLQVLSDPSISYQIETLSDSWLSLGLPSSTFSAEAIEFAYRSQCRCNPEDTAKYLTAVHDILQLVRVVTESQALLLESLIAVELSRGRWIEKSIEQSSETLGFGKDSYLGVEYSDDIDDNFVISAWNNGMKRALEDSNTCNSKRRELSEAFRILAERRGNRNMIQMIMDTPMDVDPEQSYRALGVPSEIEDSMLLVVYTMRITDQPTQLDTMLKALSLIAEVRNSSRLRSFINTGMDPGDEVIVVETPFEWPRGLNQLANTCYLNSLLQYLYTIKDLREAIAPLRGVESYKSSTLDLTRVRVGGRLVSKREIERSRAFVSRLAELFQDLECTKSRAITPSIELAKLALITSRDEEEDESSARKSGSDGSTSTDATLVDVPATASIILSEDIPSILGKRGRNSDATELPAANNQDVEMAEPTEIEIVQNHPPPLPPRKITNNSNMMFGRQHDVAECMDNCLFQIETALLGQGLPVESDEEPLRIVKSLFYGKLRQRLVADDISSETKKVTHIKDDIFSHLPVNVIEEGYDLYDGLSTYFQDTVDFEGQRAKMDISLIDLPPILQIQLQRAQFDRKTGEIYKSQAHIRFEEILFMDRFSENAEDSKRQQSRILREEMRVCRERIQRRRTEGYASYEDDLELAASFLSHLPEQDPNQKVSEVLDENAKRIQASTTQMQERVVGCKQQLEKLWANDRSMEYELTSVFIHRGLSPNFGHYFFYTRHFPEDPESWFKMNDSDVSKVTKKEVLGNPAETNDPTANAYLLVYARKGTGVIEMVKRDGM